MPIPMIKRTVDEQEIKKALSFYTENIENSYKYYLEKVACLAYKGKPCIASISIGSPKIGLATEEYILQLPGRVNHVKKFINEKGELCAIDNEYLDEEGFYIIECINYLTDTYIRVRKEGYPLNLETGTAKLNRKYPEEHYYYNKKNGHFGGVLGNKESADKFAAKLTKAMDDLDTSLIQHSIELD